VLIFNYKTPFSVVRSRYLRNAIRPNGSFSCEYPNLVRSVTIPLETYLEPQVSSFQCLEEPSYVKIFKESHTKDHKSRNRVPKWIPRNKVNYIRWRNILLEGYQILKKKGWKGLIGHPYEQGRCGIFPFLFSALHFLFIFFLLFYLLS
jgi:hypothetical protein